MPRVRCRHCRVEIKKCPSCKRMLASKTSAYRGVSRVNSRSRPWKAMIRGPEKLEYIGVFADEHEAAEAYNARARLLYGEQAKLNAIRSRTKGPEPPVAIPSMTNLSVEDIKRILGARTASKE